MSIQWIPSLSVGVEEIDAKQRELHSAADGIVAAAGAGDREREAALRRLLETARALFAEEERLLASAQDLALVRHSHEHRRFTEDLAVTLEQLARGDRAAVDALDLGGFVGAWVASHVARSDRELARIAGAARARSPVAAPAKKGAA
jgi:hemerythrin-like metal-binding protein